MTNPLSELAALLWFAAIILAGYLIAIEAVVWIARWLT